MPPGYVILADSFEHFLKETDLNVEVDAIIDQVNHKDIASVEYASEKIQALILAASMPNDIEREIESEFKKLGAKYVAVRSSATAEDSSAAAWAGQLDSYLNTTEYTLLEKVKHCWASLFTPRAIFYRFEKGLHTTKISVAVVVQKMVASEVSGIAFSVHPVTEDRNQLIIEAGLGLGEAIVSGQITPDCYVVEKQPRRIIDKNISTQSRGIYRTESLSSSTAKSEDKANEWRDISESEGAKQKLSDEQILELSELILRIERHYSFPCDIEWAYEGGKFYIVQSRPITTLQLTEKTGDNISKAKKVLTKEYGREYSLFRTVLLNDILNYEIIQELSPLPIFGGVAVYRGKGLVTGYHDREDLPKIFNRLGEVARNEKWATSVLDELEGLFVWLLPYYKNIKKIRDLSELKEFYNRYKRYFLIQSYVQILPNSQLAPDTIKERAKKIRVKIQEYNEHAEIVFEDALTHLYPGLGKDWRFLLPDEVWEQKVEEPSMREVINERKKGFVLYKDKFFAGANVADFLSQLGVVLEEVSLDNSKEITGQIAHKGIVRGIVRIVDSF